MRIRDLFDRDGRGNTADAGNTGEHSGSGDEPFPGYDRTDEKELIQQFHNHSQAELEAIEDYERAHGNRTRVLNKLHYLRQAEPLPGYDDLGAEEIAAALEDADLATIKNIRAYERKFHNRPDVQEAVEAARHEREAGVSPRAGYHATSYGPSTSTAGSRVPGPGKLAANKAVVTEYYTDVMSSHLLDAIDRLLSEDFIYNGEARGRTGQREAVAELVAAFPDLEVVTELILAEGDLVAAHQRWTGTHEGDAAGVAPTGRRIEFTSTAILRVHDGSITEAWDELDLAGLVSELAG